MSDISERTSVTDEFDGLAEVIEGSHFRRFKRKSSEAKKWIADLVKNGYRSGEKRSRRAALEEGLFMSDEMREVGVLSISPALSALLFEISLLKNREDAESEDVCFSTVLTENRGEILNVVTKSIGKLIAECYPSGLRNLDRVLLSSMPFYDDTTATEGSRWDEAGYLDSASWVFLAAGSAETFLSRLERRAPEAYAAIKWNIYGDKEDAEVYTTDDIKRALRAVYLGCIRTTCDCIVRRDGKVLGWTFRRMREGAEPSLYFSYVASTVYLGLYKRFDMIEKLRTFEAAVLRAGGNVAKYRFYEGLTDTSRRDATLQWLERNASFGKEFEDFAQYLKNCSQEELQELDLLYNEINARQPLTYKIDEFGDDGAFTLLKEASVSMAASLWKEGFGTYRTKVPFKDNMAKGPCFEDGSLVDMDVVRLSSHNNAFFNNLFVIGIILNSAYDAELQKTDPDEYDRMLNVFQLSIQNTQRCYNEIENEGLLYKIDSYILDFSDKVDADNVELAKQLRKVNMAVVPLMPLMLKSNNLMSEYVVKYPQKQMTEALKDIIRNKKRKDGVSSWVWDKDGYNAITNYYYVDALISFYRYYEQYEEPSIANEEDKLRRERIAAAKESKAWESKLRDREAALGETIAAQDAFIRQVREVCKGLARLVVNGLIDLVDEQLTEEKLIGKLSTEERHSKETIIRELNSFDRESDTVKVSKLVHVLEKLQILSLLSMENNPQLSSLLRSGDETGNDAYFGIVKSVFGGEGGTEFMRRLLTSLVNTFPPKGDK